MKEERFLEFSLAISKLNKSFQRLKTDGMKKFGLKAVHTSCLYELSLREKGMKLNEIVKACDYDKSLVSRTLKELVDLGYVSKLNSSGKYNTSYVLNDSAKVEVDKIKSLINELQLKATQKIDPAELLVFYKVLNQFTDSFDEVYDEYFKEAK